MYKNWCFLLGASGPALQHPVSVWYDVGDSVVTFTASASAQRN